jgi:penicillin-binding protein A
MALEATFPAASLIKILTASAALESNNLHPLDSLPLLGRSHTLYHFQLRPPKVSRYPKISLENAFARSVNPAFGVLGLRIGAVSLRKMGAALGFNQSQSLSECRPSRLQIPDSGFGLAEVACGYTTSTTLSPLHALRIAQGVGADGRMHPLFFTPGLRNLNDGSRFAVSTAPGDPFLSAAALDNLRTLMAATVESGTARKGFRRAFGSRSINDLDLGGKTGSLDGSDPPGRYEWYIGYARLKEKPGHGIAVVVMVINQRKRMVRASELAALMIRDWAHIPPAPVRTHHKKIRRPTYARR